MKCNKCNKNEANVFFTQSINGQETKAYLCSECAKELGIMQKLTAPAFPSFGRSFFDMSFDRTFDDFLSFFDRFDRGFSLMAAPVFAPEEKKNQVLKKTPRNPESSRNELQALRKELKAAVHSENFERAAELRDKIKKIESEREKKA